MLQETWIHLLRLIPPELHSSMVAVTTVGLEISIQTICRIEAEYVLVRGRLSGTTDTGRVFFLPLDQLNYLGFQREISDETLRQMYGESPESATPAREGHEPSGEPPITPSGPGPADAPASTAAPEETPLPDPARAPVRSPLLGKTRLIARLRARGQQGTPPRPRDK
jgi:hypothetical protein